MCGVPGQGSRTGGGSGMMGRVIDVVTRPRREQVAMEAERAATSAAMKPADEAVMAGRTPEPRAATVLGGSGQPVAAGQRQAKTLLGQ